MSLFGSIQLANNALRAQQIGLQVVGQNISNANTPGYIREQVVLSPAPTQQVGSLLLGLGVQVDGVVQIIDNFLEERLRGASSERANTSAQEEAFVQLEGLIGELGDTDLSTSLTNFFNSVSEVLNQPESVAVRNLAVLRGQTLSDDVSLLGGRVANLREDINDRVQEHAKNINELTETIRKLNIQIAATEGGDVSKSDAVGLRDQRLNALTALSEIVDIRVVEQASGTVNVSVGGEFLVADGNRRQVYAASTTDRGQAIAEVRFADTDSQVNVASGELSGLLAARDHLLGGFLDQLDDFAATLAFEFNKIFSSGQGLSGYQSVTAEFAVDAIDAPLDEAGLPFTPSNGSFDILVKDQETGITETTNIRVDLNGLNGDSSLQEIVAQLNAVNGVTATIGADRVVSIVSDSSDQEFAFGADTSGLLAALGINTFFTGSGSGSLNVAQALKNDPGKFAASSGGIATDTANAERLAGFFDRPLESQNNDSLSTLYGRLTGGVTQGSAVARNVAEGASVFESSLAGQKLATSGVNLDEEIVRMIQYQRAFQMTARYISELDELLQILINL
ncbi:MAG: flagellar hook-associated protein FlgK [Pirellulales bacterium]